MILMSSPWGNGLFWIISTLKHNCLTARENLKLQFEEVVVTYLYIWERKHSLMSTSFIMCGSFYIIHGAFSNNMQCLCCYMWYTCHYLHFSHYMRYFCYHMQCLRRCMCRCVITWSNFWIICGALFFPIKHGVRSLLWGEEVPGSG